MPEPSAGAVSEASGTGADMPELSAGAAAWSAVTRDTQPAASAEHEVAAKLRSFSGRLLAPRVVPGSYCVKCTDCSDHDLVLCDIELWH